MFKDALHILNPNACHRDCVAKFFKKNPKLKAVWVNRDSHPTHLETIVQWAIMEGYKNLVVWGGDGTISRVVQTLYFEDVLDDMTLALMPVGTGNDFVRRFDYGSWRKWRRLFERGQTGTAHFDVGLLETDGIKRVFVNNAGFGRTQETLRHKKPNPIKDILSFSEKKVQLEWGAASAKQYETTRCLMMIVFNSPYFNKGMYFARDIKPDDGVLTAFMVPPQSSTSLLFKFLKSKFGLALASNSDLKLEGNFIEVETEENLYPQVDGEVVTLNGMHQLRFSVIPHALKCAVPQKYEQSHASSN